MRSYIKSFVQNAPHFRYFIQVAADGSTRNHSDSECQIERHLQLLGWNTENEGEVLDKFQTGALIMVAHESPKKRYNNQNGNSWNKLNLYSAAN